MTFLIIDGDLQIDAVCNEYTFCCETEWNRTCAETARNYCETSSPTASPTTSPPQAPPTKLSPVSPPTKSPTISTISFSQDITLTMTLKSEGVVAIQGASPGDRTLMCILTVTGGGRGIHVHVKECGLLCGDEACPFDNKFKTCAQEHCTLRRRLLSTMKVYVEATRTSTIEGALEKTDIPEPENIQVGGQTFTVTDVDVKKGSITTNAPPKSGSNGLSTWELVLIIGGCIVGVILTLFFIKWLWTRCGDVVRHEEITPDDTTEDSVEEHDASQSALELEQLKEDEQSQGQEELAPADNV